MTLNKIRKFILQNSPKSGQEILDFIDQVKVINYYNNTHYYKNGQLHREDGPAVEYANGDKEWWLNGKPHREDGPACEYSDGTKYWCLNGKYHRTDGPAMEWASGTKYWYINGERVVPF